MSSPPRSRRCLAPSLLAAAALLVASCARGPAPGDLAGWNVVLITIDTLRADRVGFAGYDAAETPVLDGLAEGGVVFEEAVASAPVTLPSHATILTGRYPPSHGALDNGFYSLGEDVPTLATVLRRAGYRTAAFVGAFVLHGQYGLDEGFETYDDHFRHPRLAGQEDVERRAEEVVARACEWVERREGDDPFLLWVHCFDPHAPYDPPEPYRARFADRYDGEIAYTDHALGRLVDTLHRAGLRGRTLVIVASDHGEAFGDGGERTHGLLLRGSTLRVPLVMCAPGVLPEGRRVKGTVSTADVLPTALELLGAGAPEGIEGRSLVTAIGRGAAEAREAYSETRMPTDLLGWSMLAGVRNDRWAYVRAPRPELYDLTADPGESENVFAEHAAAAAELDGRVKRTLARGRDAPAPRELSREVADRLSALGYISSGRPAEPTGADPKDRLDLWNRLEEAEAAMAAGRLDVALTAAERILREDPGNPEARVILGQALVRAGRREEGLGELRKLLAEGSLRGRRGNRIAQALSEAGDLAGAETLYRAMAEAEPELSEHPFNLGVLLWQQGRRDEAIAAYESALERNPDAVHVMANLAQALSQARRGEADGDRAVALLDRAVELSPEDDRPRLFRVYLLRDLGRMEEARRAARELAGRPVLQGVSPAEVADAVRSTED